MRLLEAAHREHHERDGHRLPIRRQDDCLGQELPHDPSASGAKRRTQGDLASRLAARAMSRLATLALVMSSKSAARPVECACCDTKKGPISGLGRACVSGTTSSDTSLWVEGYSRASAAATTPSAARACASETPGFSRPSTVKVMPGAIVED